MKTTKIISLLIILTQIGSLLAFGLSIYTIYGVLTSAFSEGLSFEMDFDEVTGDSTLHVEFTLENPSYIDAKVALGLSMLDRDGESIASGSTLVEIPPSGSEAITLILEVSQEDFERIALEGESSLELYISLRTLYDLVGISDTITIPQEVSR